MSDNEIIIAFMGGIQDKRGAYIYLMPDGVGKFPAHVYGLREMEFDKSWDWLMPAFQKFRTLPINDEDNQDIHRDHCDHITRSIGMGDLTEAHKLLVSGIKWHNLIKS